MTIHFGVLIPSTNTTTETEYARLPAGYQAHYARVRTSTPGHPFAPGRDEEVDYQSQLLATAKVRMVVLIQTSASLFAWITTLPSAFTLFDCAKHHCPSTSVSL